MKYDVCIIGGGAAGLAAAASFYKNLNICILEKNDKLGRKILATGGGRCNLSNEQAEGYERTIEFFKRLGLEVWKDEEGRFYPYSGRASDVVSILTDAIGENFAIMTGFEVKAVSNIKSDDPHRGRFMISGSETIFADNVIFAMGGKAAPQYGTTGDGYGILKTLGHTITRVYPILTGVECRGTDFSALKGIRARGEVTLLKDGSPLVENTGEIQFTEDGLSGICVFNLTPYIRVEEGESPLDAMEHYEISLDLAPDFSPEEFKTHGERAKAKGKPSGYGLLTGKLATAVGERVKDWRIQVTGVKGWRDAQATSGGVVLDEINMETMESKIVQGLYIAGEIINRQGSCGGYNLQNAWETGIKAAEAI
ncbi:MAG: NAD(P)/FAD-dependent oxidoreductase, partial [Eubacteriales bacterium]|nr:NAD(P)/FAD-dependent oxidoreductase [Eubacteriales bacterium]